MSTQQTPEPLPTLSSVAHARLAAMVQSAPQRMAYLYGVLDVAIDENVYRFIEPALHAKGGAKDHAYEIACLYDGDPAIKYARYAPYLLRVPLENGLHQSALLEQWLTKGWSAHWGIFLSSTLSPDKLKQHLKKLIQVSTPQGKKAWMRFYDPRVLPKLLADMGPANAPLFFGNAVQAYLLPGGLPQELQRITFDQSRLIDKFTSMGRARVETLQI
jgi:Domain of unknown function (DUF4123)